MREQNEADGSGSTAQFRAFVDRSGGPEATQAWTMGAPRSRVAMLTAVVIGVAVVLALIAFAVIG
jgi:multisubunit Na+/H+ antiporter MnhC subunit